jgi:5-methylcytosine-specific restriction endonuclease McrA
LQDDRVSNFKPSIQDEILLIDFYHDCPTGWAVDHIIPLTCGGQHHISNVQHVPKILNLQKSNSFFPIKIRGVVCKA